MHQPANSFIRFLAFILDSVILLVTRYVFNLVFTLFGFSRPVTTDEEQMLQDLAKEMPDPSVMFGAWAKIATETGSGLETLLFFALVVTATIFFVTKKEGTPGKLALGLRIQSIKTQKNPTLVQTLLREIIGKAILWPLTLNIGILVMFFNKNRRGIQDFVGSTVVVEKRGG
jgi:uncharacterized RDD family membrane protein YckC